MSAHNGKTVRCRHDSDDGDDSIDQKPTMLTFEDHGRYVQHLHGKSQDRFGNRLDDRFQQSALRFDCPDCGADHGGDIAIKRLRSGSRLIGCTRYPDCDYSLPLPRRGAIEVTDERCDEHDLPFLVVGDEGDGDEDGDREGDGDATADDRWELGCPICNYREYRARQEGSELQVVGGIGEKTAEKLEAAGVESVRELKRADPDELAGTVDGIIAESVRDWQSAAD